jgi:hypothetical protein
MATMLMNAPIQASNISSLIPVLVTGIQQRRVCGAGEFFRPKDLGWLDPCDKHRDEGRGEASGLVSHLEGASP